MCLFEGTSVWPLRGEGGWLRSHPGFLEESAAEMGCGGFRGAGMGRVVAGPSPRQWRLEGVRALQTVMRCADKPPGASSRSGRDWTLQRRGRFLLAAFWLQAALCSLWDLRSQRETEVETGSPNHWTPGASSVFLLAQAACGCIFGVLLLAAKNLPSCGLPQKLNPGTRIQGQRVYLGGDPEMQQQEGVGVRAGRVQSHSGSGVPCRRPELGPARETVGSKAGSCLH